MKNLAIELNNVSKKYRLGQRGYRSLREDITRLFNFKSPKGSNNSLWALKDISFSVKKGEALGVIGPNGAGKSTLLKLLSRVTLPTEGRVIVKGKFGALIELTAGFHPELTGRENIYLYGSIKGMKKSEINKKFDKIVVFSGLEKFIDTPIKRYSSGMNARLGFSVSAHVDPDILIIDEVLSVGDLAFQRKCLDHMAKIRDMNKTIVFVSHNLSAVKGLCDRVIWIDRGKIKKVGCSNDTIDAYISYAMSDRQYIKDDSYVDQKTRWGTGEAKFRNIEILDSTGKQTHNFVSGDKIMIRLEYEAYEKINCPEFGIAIFNNDNVKLFGSYYNKDRVGSYAIDGHGALECTLDTISMRPGAYYLTVGINVEIGNLSLDRIGRAAAFNIVSEKKHETFEAYDSCGATGLVNMKHKWQVVKQKCLDY